MTPALLDNAHYEVECLCGLTKQFTTKPDAQHWAKTHEHQKLKPPNIWFWFEHGNGKRSGINCGKP